MIIIIIIIITIATLDNVYGAAIMIVIARVHLVHLMNVEQRQAAVGP